jgi:hypothetical protein
MKTLSLVCTLLFSLMLVSCGNGGGDSSEVTMKKFIDEMKVMDFKAAKEYTSNSTDKTMDFLSKRMEMLKEMDKEEEILAVFDNLDFSKATATCQEETDKATCQLCEEAKSKCKDITLIKEQGKWVVHLPKESEASK